MVRTFYRDGRLRSVVAESAIYPRPGTWSNQPPEAGLELADIVPVDGTPPITAYIQA